MNGQALCRRLIYALLPVVTVSCAVSIPPLAPARVDNVVDAMHGESVADPYRWLEDAASPETMAFTKAQNARTTAILRAVPGRKAIRKRLGQLMEVGTLGTPASRKRADGSLRYFYTRRRAGQDQPLLYVRDGLRGEDRVLLDPNKLSTDGTAALDWYFPSRDGALIAYGISLGGDERSVLRIREVESGRDRADVIDRTRACSLAWLPDASGFYYTRYPAKGSVPDAELAYHRSVYFHALGDDPARDVRVFGQGRDMKDWPHVELSPSGRWVVFTASQGWNKSEIYLQDRQTPNAPIVPVVTGIPAIFNAEVQDDRLLILTNHEAPRYRLYAVDVTDLTKKTPLIAEGPDVLQSAHQVGGTLLATYLKNASSRLRLFGVNGAPRGEVALPSIGSVWSTGGRHDGEEAFFGFTSFAVAPSVYRLDLLSAKTELWERIEAPIRPDDFEVAQVRYPSKDGTSISMFLIHKKGIVRDGNNPTYLTGYGGFNVSLTPTFIQSAYLFLEKGGVIAMPNLRGGGEYGEAWHEAGMLGKKQNVFDDFTAGAQWLIREKVTRAERLAISGGSNGGLLIGVALTQRPELFRAAVCMVPLLDMVRYHRFLIAKLWIPEYGSAEVKEQFEWLYAYSPYHRVQDGTRYPAVLFTAAEGDSRVDPLHAKKMAARVQKATSGSADQPILLRVETKAGHGAGKPVGKLVDELTDRWSFVFWQLGMAP